MPSPLVLQPDATAGKDTTIRDDAPTNNLGSAITVQLYYPDVSVRFLMQFDLTGIPSSATVTDATLELNNYYRSAAAQHTMTLYRVLRDWDEGAQNNAEGDCCWNNAKTGVAWATAGCGNTISDRESDALASHAWTTTGVISVSLSPSKVQEWIAGSLPNYGFLAVITSGGRYFYSSDHPTASYRPKLTVTYTEGGGATQHDVAYTYSGVGSDIIIKSIGKYL